MASKRRTQAERRTETRLQVLDSACKLFGGKGYDKLSLDEIAADCGLTTRPIYHYFGNKKALFAAVNDCMEQRIIERMAPGSDALGNWSDFLDLCEDPAFRQIVLIDSPNILGRERWASSEVSARARDNIAHATMSTTKQQFRLKLVNRVLMAAYAEAALIIAETDDIKMARQQAEQLMGAMLSNMREQLNPMGVNHEH